MPEADTPCTIINGKNGYTRDNGSFVLGRVMRDLEYWADPEVLAKKEEVIDAAWKFESSRAGKDEHVPRPRQAGLIVAFYMPSTTREAGIAGMDRAWWSGVVACVIQLGIAAIPCGLYGDWSVLLITAAATLLCLATGMLKQWRTEKWACRRMGKRDARPFILTRGNGAQYAIAILSNEQSGLNLEDLATGFANLDPPSITLFSRFAMLALGVLWVALLITSSAITRSAWFLIAVGGLGMLQNIYVAGWHRKPEALGLPLEYKGVVGYPKVIDTLHDVERKYEKLGNSMVPTFFPGDLWPKEVEEFDKIAKEWKEKKDAKKAAEAQEKPNMHDSNNGQLSKAD